MLNKSSHPLLNQMHFNCCFSLRNQEINVAVEGFPALLIGVINALLSPVAVVGNALVLVAIWRNVSFRTPSYIFLAGLAVTDFATGLITQPLYASDILATFCGRKLSCFAITTLHTTGRYLAIITVEIITTMSIERWLHMSRRSLLTVRRANVICGVLLCLPLPHIVARMWLISIKSYRTLWEPILVAIVGFICFSMTSFSYLKVFRLIRRHQRQIQSSLSSQNILHPNIDLAKYKKSVYTILFVLVIFLLGYLPHVICVSLSVMLKTSSQSFAIVLHLSITLFYTSSSLNPLLYTWRMQDIRDEVKLLILKIVCKE